MQQGPARERRRLQDGSYRQDPRSPLRCRLCSTSTRTTTSTSAWGRQGASTPGTSPTSSSSATASTRSSTRARTSSASASARSPASSCASCEELDLAYRRAGAPRHGGRRLDSSQKLKRTIEEALPCGERSPARACASSTRWSTTLSASWTRAARFKTATTALATVTSEEGLAPRRGVANNLTTVGKDAIRYMNSAVTQDVVRRQAEIDAAPEDQKSRILKNAMNERVMRLKRFNVFHENPEMVGVEGGSVNAADQSHYYLNQAKEKREFE